MPESTVETPYPFPVIQDNRQSAVLELDKKTPDNHVPRDDRLIRLTGAHPFNSEPPLTTLFETGFLTPADIHFVRNHGPVPQISDDDMMDWEIEVSGMVENPIKINLRKLIDDFEQVTLPVTLVCAGNRRKEQNMVRKGSGFNWGAAGCSTSLWTGVLLRDLLMKACPHRKARYVCMEGGDRLPHGPYGTSVRLAWAMDFDRAIMLAWMQNGVPLSPDHGRPLRVIVPGVIGGRSVKWLKKLIITDKPSTNFYHIHDNRVLPTIVTPEMAKEEEKWWTDERYAISNLNIQSATVYPAHDEVLKLTANDDNETYTIRGYAYNGGGIRVGRVEVTLDGGSSWKLADIEYPEDEYRKHGITELFGGKVDMEDRYLCFCWCFWKTTIKVSEISSSRDIMVRAMDINMNLQPRDMYWNVTSMLNNWWYRVAIIKDTDQGLLRFEHPVLPAMQQGGWMQRVKEEGGDLLSRNYGEVVDSEDGVKQVPRPKPKAVEIVMTRPEALQRIITQKELDEHANEENPWFVVDGQVYDGTDYLSSHPGGPESITMVAGTDATEDFMAIHSETAKKLLAQYHIGTLEKTTNVPTTTDSDAASNEALSEKFLDAKKWKKLALKQKTILSKDSRMLCVDLEHPEQATGLPVGKHLFLRLKDNDDNNYVMRAYTPFSSHRIKGRLELLIKVYFPTATQAGGKMTMLLEALKEGEFIEFKGPTGSFEYMGYGDVSYKGAKRKVDKFYMIAGGSGITPCYQVLKEIYELQDDPTEAVLLFSNRFEEDILCREELDMMARENKPEGHMQMKYWLSGKLPEGWNKGVGRIDQHVMDVELLQMVRSESSMLLVCGPDGMLNTVKDWVATRAFDPTRVVYF